MPRRKPGRKSWTVRMIPLSANMVEKYLYSNKTRGAVSRHKKRWDVVLRAVCGEPKDIVDYPVRFKFSVVRGGKQDEADNLPKSLKPVLDSMRKLGWCVDDSAEWVKVEYEEVAKRDKSLHKTTIEWEPQSELREEQHGDNE